MPDVLSKAYPMAPFLANYKLVTQSLYGGDLDMKQNNTTNRWLILFFDSKNRFK
jgi:hypothetical protein